VTTASAQVGTDERSYFDRICPRLFFLIVTKKNAKTNYVNEYLSQYECFLRNTATKIPKIKEKGTKSDRTFLKNDNVGALKSRKYVF